MDVALYQINILLLLLIIIIIYVNNPDKKQDDRTDFMYLMIYEISFILWLMHNYLTAQSRLKYCQYQPRLSTSDMLTAVLAHDHR